MSTSTVPLSDIPEWILEKIDETLDGTTYHEYGGDVDGSSVKTINADYVPEPGKPYRYKIVVRHKEFFGSQSVFSVEISKKIIEPKSSDDLKKFKSPNRNVDYNDPFSDDRFRDRFDRDVFTDGYLDPKTMSFVPNIQERANIEGYITTELVTDNSDRSTITKSDYSRMFEDLCSISDDKRGVRKIEWTAPLSWDTTKQFFMDVQPERIY